MMAINSYFLVQEIHLDCKDWVDLSYNKIGPVRCSDFTLEMNCSLKITVQPCSVFGLFARNELFGHFAVHQFL